MADLSMHGIKKVVVKEAHKLVLDDGSVSYCRIIEIDGDEKIDIKLFTEKKEDLDIITIK